jgi:hypothetical protein
MISFFDDMDTSIDKKPADIDDPFFCMNECIYSAEEFTEIELPEKEYYLIPIVSDSSIIMIIGYRGLGKSWFGLSICICIVQGLPLGPWKAGVPVPYLYLDGEMAAQDTQKRLLNLNPKKIYYQPLFIYSDAIMNKEGYPKANLLNEKWREFMKKLLLEFKVKVFVIDNIASLSGGIDENAKKDWDPINSWLINLRHSGVTSVLLHHASKDGGQRGTSAREDNIDLSIVLKKPPNSSPEKGADFIVSFSKSRVPYEYLQFMQDTRFTLGKNEHGETIWTWGASRAEVKKEILRLLNEGKTYDEIHADLKIARGSITSTRKSAIKDGLLSSEGKLTADGRNYIDSQNI